MASSLAVWLVMLAHDSQRSRNLVMESHADTPVVLMTLLALSAGLDHWLRFPGSPSGLRLPTLIGMATDLGPMVSECLSAMVEAPLDTTMFEEPSTPSQTSIQAEVDALHNELRGGRDAFVQWRLTLSNSMGAQFDRRLHTVLWCIDELTYFDTWPPLRMLGSWLRTLQLDIQQALLNSNALATTGCQANAEMERMMTSP